MKKFACAALALLVNAAVFAQNTVPFPTGSRDFEAVTRWGHTAAGTNWNTSKYLPFIYRDMWFRLMPPTAVTYNATTNVFTNTQPTQKYPVILFFHGAGETGSDNNKQLVHGAQTHMNAVTNGTFPGFLIYPQNVAGGDNKAGALIRKLLQTLPIDQNRIYVHGLSNGAKWAWDFLLNNPELVAAAAPMSGILGDQVKTEDLLYTPLRLAQGGLDSNPAPHYTQTIVDYYAEEGGHLQYFLFPQLGHGTWNTMYALPDFFSWFLSKKKNQILVRYDKNEICPGDPINVDMGFSPDFLGYEWYKDGVLIPGATTNKIIVHEFGNYTGKVQYIDGTWSEMSAVMPVRLKSTTVTPNIVNTALRSNVLPSPDGRISTSLELPAGYTSYTWRDANTNVVVNEGRVFPNAAVGAYTAIVQEQNGCSSQPSAVFNVASSNGPNPPDELNGLLGFAPSQTTTTLTWTQNPEPNINETAFEVYRSLSASGPFTLVAILPADATGFNDSGLDPNVHYFYKVRPVSATGAAVATEPVDVLTQLDVVPPTTPTDLRMTTTTNNSVTLAWNAATDNTGIDRYNIYLNGTLAKTSTTTTTTVFSLTPNTNYNFTIKAVDLAGNLSPFSNQLTTATVLRGLNYKYYEGTWSALPNFSTLIPIETGNTPGVDISVRNRDENYAIQWEGYIYIPVAGNYTFETNSDDGSRVWINGSLVVDNDGAHGMQYREGTRNLSVGSHQIVIGFQQGAGGFGMEFYWKNTAHGITSRQLVPTVQFMQTGPNQTAPNPPTNLTATAVSYDRINLTWSDAGGQETGFQVYRSTVNEGPYAVIATTAANVTTYADMTVSPNTRYYYRVQAIGASGSSGFSTEKLLGLNWGYYEQTFPTTPVVDVSLPKKTGTNLPNFALTMRDRDTNFGFKFDGRINIVQGGNYRFFVTADDAAELWINNVRVVNATSANSETQSNSITLSANTKYTIKVLMRQSSGSSRLEVRYQGLNGLNIAKQLIPTSAFVETQINALTNPLPPPPVAASGLVATNAPDRSIDLTWVDNSADETSMQVLRSVGNPNSFVVYKTLDPNTTSYTDTNLFARLTYYYKIVAKGVGGGINSNQAQATIPNGVPEFTAEIPNFTVRFDEEHLTHIEVNEPDGDFVIIGGKDLPEVAQLYDNGDGTADLVVLATEAQQGVYENLKIYTNDNFGGSDTLTFTLTVNSNHNPTISEVTPVNLKETYVSRFALTAEELDGETVTWELQDAPPFLSAVPSGNTLNIQVKPLVQHAGTYDVTVIARDGNGGSDTEIIPITITDYNPTFNIWLNFAQNNGPLGTSPWINLRTNTSNPNSGTTPIQFTGGNNVNLQNDLGATTPFSVSFENGWSSILASGGVTPGLYPDNVMIGNFQSLQTTPRIIKVSGLNPDGKYNLKFMSSTTQTGPRFGVFTVTTQPGFVPVELNASGNTNNTADLVSLTPNAAGEIIVSVLKKSGSSSMHLNAMVIQSIYEGTSIPASPTNLTSSITSDTKIRLQWADNAFDETAYEVYESTDNISFTKIATAGIDATSYIDGTFTAGTTYYYKVQAVNGVGPSADYTNTLTVVGPNRSPVMGTISPFSVTEMEYKYMTVTATDPDGELVTFTTTGAPYFMWTEEVDYGVVNLMFTPQLGDATAVPQGLYSFQLIARDSQGAETPATVTVRVNKIGEVEMKVSFTDNNPARLAAAPWTNVFTNVANTTVNLKDGDNAATTVNMKIVNAWSGINANGGYQATVDGSGPYPNAAMASSFFISDNTARTLQFTGLKTNRIYDFTFFASRIEGAGVTTPARNTIYAVGTKTAKLNALGNTSNTVKLIGITPDAAGTINLTVTRETGSTFGYLNAFVIREYQGTGAPAAPSGLTAQVLGRSSIKLNWTDNSNDETSFRVMRASEAAGPFTEVQSLAPNVTTFTNNSLTPGTRYFYKIVAVNAITTAESDVVDISTFDYSVSINFYAKNGGPTNWNNIALSNIVTGDAFNNLFDETNANTGIAMSVVAGFTASNGLGVNTGNNSGVLPDKVMEGSYFLDPGVVAQLRFDNLSFLKRYSFQFFASRNLAGNRNTEYTIGGTTVVLNAALNSTQLVQINNVVPDLDGTVTVSIVSQSGALFGYLGAIIIQAAPNPNPPQGRIAADEISMADKFDGSNILQRAIASPNPFTNVIRVNLEQPQSKIKAVLFNSVGQKVAEALVDEMEELSEFEMQVNSELPPGIYMLKLHDSKSQAVHKMMKQ